MRRIVLPLPGNEKLGAGLADNLEAELGRTTISRFPDGESYVRIDSDVEDACVVVVCTLHRPDEKLLPLYFLTRTAVDLGARCTHLVAPYLAYMRQDARFRPGEGVTSEYFARLVSTFTDGLVTVDPHLHRRSSLSEIYDIPTDVVHAARHISAWIRASISRPVLIGPDSESEQWVAAVAADADAPYLVLQKKRHGDREVDVSVPKVDHYRDHTPVLVDDIISTAHTMIETVGHLRSAGMSPPVCIGVHAVFADDAYEQLLKAGAADVITCNTIPHQSNRIDLTGALVEGVKRISPA